jgi:hypothetical protein
MLSKVITQFLILCVLHAPPVEAQKPKYKDVDVMGNVPLIDGIAL